MLSGFGGGMLAGSRLFGAVGQRLPRRAVMAGGLALTGGPLAAMAAEPPLAAAVALLALAGLGSGPFNPLLFTLLPERVPPALRGRVIGSLWGAVLVAAPVGMALAGGLIAALGLPAVLLAIGAGFGAAAGALWGGPVFRELDPPSPTPAEAP